MKGLKKNHASTTTKSLTRSHPSKVKWSMPKCRLIRLVADFGKTLTINQRPSKLVYSDIREENYMFFFGQC